MSEEIKLCKDCKHYRPFLFFFSHLSMCAALPDKVSGKAKDFCHLQREYEHRECGPEGRLFEAKEKHSSHFDPLDY